MLKNFVQHNIFYNNFFKNNVFYNIISWSARCIGSIGTSVCGWFSNGIILYPDVIFYKPI